MQLNPYLNFNGNCREAMEFYKQALGGELQLQTVEGSPIEMQCPSGMKHHILHSMLTVDGAVIMGSDMIGPDGFIPGNTMAISVNCSSEPQIRDYYEKLRAGGQVIDELKKQFWGAWFGVLTDRFGVRWMLNWQETA